MTDLNEQFSAFQSRFNADAADDMEEVFQFDVEGTTFYLAIKDAACHMGEGEHDDPSVTLRLNSDTMKDLMAGETSGMQAFMSGSLKVEGNMMLATKLGDLFGL
ncbi:SCP2 sterol-binding domain-containing protein [Salinispirillum marinum]|uniref:SCP2 sterol-binding domain-containing protein n=2 Tax=Saccharospirillaceae TaxID=255527 RepID=A0ABV8BFN3_9GAMM